MIQRIQTLYLLGAALLHLLLFYFPVWIGEAAQQKVMLFANKTIITPAAAETMNTTLLILNLVIILGSFGAIFLYKRRPLQLKLSRFLVLISCGFIGLMFYTVEQTKPLLKGVNYTSHYDAGTYLPLAALLLLFLAGQAILRDERLVRSADRLR